jgi:hypothetical protein
VTQIGVMLALSLSLPAAAQQKAKKDIRVSAVLFAAANAAAVTAASAPARPTVIRCQVHLGMRVGTRNARSSST